MGRLSCVFAAALAALCVGTLPVQAQSYRWTSRSADRPVPVDACLIRQIGPRLPDGKGNPASFFTRHYDLTWQRAGFTGRRFFRQLQVMDGERVSMVVTMTRPRRLTPLREDRQARMLVSKAPIWVIAHLAPPYAWHGLVEGRPVTDADRMHLVAIAGCVGTP